eukprot:Opistho-2@52004
MPILRLFRHCVTYRPARVSLPRGIRATMTPRTAHLPSVAGCFHASPPSPASATQRSPNADLQQPKATPDVNDLKGVGYKALLAVLTADIECNFSQFESPGETERPCDESHQRPTIVDSATMRAPRQSKSAGSRANAGKPMSNKKSPVSNMKAVKGRPGRKWTMNSFMLFSIQYRKALRARFPGVTNGSLSEMLSNVWKEVPRERKEYFQAKAKEIRDAHRQAGPTREEPLDCFDDDMTTATKLSVANSVNQPETRHHSHSACDGQLQGLRVLHERQSAHVTDTGAAVTIDGRDAHMLATTHMENSPPLHDLVPTASERTATQMGSHWLENERDSGGIFSYNYNACGPPEPLARLYPLAHEDAREQPRILGFPWTYNSNAAFGWLRTGPDTEIDLESPFVRNFSGGATTLLNPGLPNDMHLHPCPLAWPGLPVATAAAARAGSSIDGFIALSDRSRITATADHHNLSLELGQPSVLATANAEQSSSEGSVTLNASRYADSANDAECRRIQTLFALAETSSADLDALFGRVANASHADEPSVSGFHNGVHGCNLGKYVPNVLITAPRSFPELSTQSPPYVYWSVGVTMLPNSAQPDGPGTNVSDR